MWLINIGVWHSKQACEECMKIRALNSALGKYVTHLNNTV